jgi:hypothetical protein
LAVQHQIDTSTTGVFHGAFTNSKDEFHGAGYKDGCGKGHWFSTKKTHQQRERSQMQMMIFMVQVTKMAVEKDLGGRLRSGTWASRASFIAHVINRISTNSPLPWHRVVHTTGAFTAHSKTRYGLARRLRDFVIR